MLKYNNSTILKLKQILEETGYIVRLEKGNFNSGYALVKDKKVVVINKFLRPDAKILALLEIIDQVDIDPLILTLNLKKYYNNLVKNSILTRMQYKLEEE